MLQFAQWTFFLLFWKKGPILLKRTQHSPRVQPRTGEDRWQKDKDWEKPLQWQVQDTPSLFSYTAATKGLSYFLLIWFSELLKGNTFLFAVVLKAPEQHSWRKGVESEEENTGQIQRSIYCLLDFPWLLGVKDQRLPQLCLGDIRLLCWNVTMEN